MRLWGGAQSALWSCSMSTSPGLGGATWRDIQAFQETTRLTTVPLASSPPPYPPQGMHQLFLEFMETTIPPIPSSAHILWQTNFYVSGFPIDVSLCWGITNCSSSKAGELSLPAPSLAWGTEKELAEVVFVSLSVWKWWVPNDLSCNS